MSKLVKEINKHCLKHAMQTYIEKTEGLIQATKNKKNID